MKKLINNPVRFVDEMLEGILAAHPDCLKAVDGDTHALVRRDAPVRGKVGIVTGGGSGHLPLFLGYVGRGLCDGVAVGDVFRSPGVETIAAVTKAVDGGSGVLHLIGNYGGDVLNFGLAADLVALEGVSVRTVLVSDDVASAPKGHEHERRGIAGLFFAYKVAGAVAERGGNLDEVEQAAKWVVRNTRSMGVALTPCTVPAIGRPGFEIGPDEMEIGMGIHGEPGVRRCQIEPVDMVVDTLVDTILADYPFEGTDVAVLVNGLGATPLEELYIACRRVISRLTQEGVNVARVFVGEYATSLEMAGMSISLMALEGWVVDCLDAAAHSPLLNRLIGRC